MPDPLRRQQCFAELLAAARGAADIAALRNSFVETYPEFVAEIDDLIASLQNIANPSQVKDDSAQTSSFVSAAPTTHGDSRRFQPRMVGEYELIEELGSGGMGVVYKARHVRLNRLTALKMLKAGAWSDRDQVSRFMSEALAAAMLDHPGIVPIFEVKEDAGQSYLALAYVEGMSLEEHVRDRVLPAQEAARLVLALAKAIEYAHGKGVIHRDLKPANILIDAHGEPHITDFGLARLIEQGPELTIEGQVLGTPSYMAPEQAGGFKDMVGKATDVYGLGAILYRLLTGQPPFRGASSHETILQVLQNDPPSVRTLNLKAPRAVEAICMKCLNKDRGQRYASAAKLAEDLEAYMEGKPVQATCPTVWQKVGAFLRHERRINDAAWVLLITALIKLAVAWSSFWVAAAPMDGDDAFVSEAKTSYRAIVSTGDLFWAIPALVGSFILIQRDYWGIAVVRTGAGSALVIHVLLPAVFALVWIGMPDPRIWPAIWMMHPVFVDPVSTVSCLAYLLLEYALATNREWVVFGESPRKLVLSHETRHASQGHAIGYLFLAPIFVPYVLSLGSYAAHLLYLIHSVPGFDPRPHALMIARLGFIFPLFMGLVVAIESPTRITAIIFSNRRCRLRLPFGRTIELDALPICYPITLWESLKFVGSFGNYGGTVAAARANQLTFIVRVGAARYHFSPKDPKQFWAEFQAAKSRQPVLGSAAPDDSPTAAISQEAS